MCWSITVTSPEQYANIHPEQWGRRPRYLLRHWRYAEARRRLLAELLGWVRYRLRRSRWFQPPPPPPELSQAALRRWLRPGDILLDAGGAELAWLETTLARLPAGLFPAIAYRSDIRRTGRYAYHPVETVWLLEQSGYQVWLLTTEGPVVRPGDWHAARPAGAPGPWLLATPPGYADATSGRDLR